MGLLTLTELIGEVQVALLNRTDLTQARCVTALNFAQTQISRQHDFKELKAFYNVNTFFTSSAFNDKFLPLAPYTKHVHTAVLLDNTSSRKLVEKPWRNFDRMFPMPEALARSRPAIYSRWNDTLILYPVPQQVYPVFMRITTYPRPFNLALGPSAVSDYDGKDDILIDLAAAYLWGSIGRTDKASDFIQKGELHFNDAVKQDNDMPDLDINIDIQTDNLGNYWADPFARTMPS
jgi:hypothetical protein